MEEIWKIADHFYGIEASNFGRIRRGGHIYKPSIKKGYKVIRLCDSGKRKEIFVHRLVCRAFNGRPPINKRIVAHKDGNKLNNFQDNLRWSTQQENMDDRGAHGTTMRGDSHYAAVLKSSDIPRIRLLLSRGVNQQIIAKEFGVTNYAISDIKRGKSWKNY